MECTYYHLREQYGILRLKCQNAPLLSQPPIVQRLLINLGYRNGNLSPGNLDPAYLEDRREERITDAFSWARDLLYAPSLRTAWSDMPSANMSNAGWALYVRHVGRWEGLSAVAYNEISREPVNRFHNWGYCIWDNARLHKWGMLERGKYSIVDTRKWSDEEMTRHSCRRCWSLCLGHDRGFDHSHQHHLENALDTLANMHRNAQLSST